MDTDWRDVDGYVGIYEVSNRGELRRAGKAKLLKPSENSRGYMVVVLCKDGRTKGHLVHRLVAAAFCPHPSECNVVNHIDNNPKNNNASNLEWTTQKGNIHHAAKMGVVNLRPVVRSNGAQETIYPTLRAVEADGFNPASVCDCCKGRLKTHRGYRWRYA